LVILYNPQINPIIRILVTGSEGKLIAKESLEEVQNQVPDFERYAKLMWL